MFQLTRGGLSRPPQPFFRTSSIHLCMQPFVLPDAPCLAVLPIGACWNVRDTPAFS